MFNYFESIKNSKIVKGRINIEQFIERTRKGFSWKDSVLEAREALKANNESKFNFIKENDLTIYGFNFLFNKTRSNDTILKNEDTGLIYLDYDRDQDINLTHPLIHASWKSISGKGRGLLVRIEGKTLNNFILNYKTIGNELGIEVDQYAAKATQVNVQSYDEHIYYNPISTIWKAKNQKEKTPHFIPKFNNTKTVKNDLGYSGKSLRFDNLNDFEDHLDFKGEPMIDYGQIKLSKVYYNYDIPQGKRYVSLNAQCYQLRALNPNVDKAIVANYLLVTNKFRCKPPLPEYEVHKIIENVLNLPEEKLIPLNNYQRRFFFDSNIDLSVSEKRSLVMTKINKDKSKKSIEIIKKTIDNWDFDMEGKITQKKLAKVSGKNIKTVQKYHYEFKNLIKSLNEKNRPP